MNKIIGISGPPGSGKTSIVQLLSDKLNTRSCVHMDNYSSLTDDPVEEISRWLDRRGDYDGLSFPLLADHLEKLKNGLLINNHVSNVEMGQDPYILFETHFGRAHQQTGCFIDTLIWIDIPLDLALARNIGSFVETFVRDRSPGACEENLGWIGGYVDNYINHVRGMLHAQRELILERVDIVVSGEDDINTSAEHITSYLDSVA